MKMLIPTAFCFLICALVVNCRQSDVPPSCNVSKPLEELSWLKAIVDDTIATKNQELAIFQATYRNQTVYSVYITPGPDMGINTLYDCRGRVLCKGYMTIAGIQSNCKSVLEEALDGPLLYRR